MGSLKRDFRRVVAFRFLFLNLLLIRNETFAFKNMHYSISALCSKESNLPLYRRIDGAVLTSEGEDNLSCVLTFQTDSILQRFMLRFERLALDCNDHLFIYDGAHAFGNYKGDLSCSSSEADVETFITMTNFITLKYVTDKWSPPQNGFKLVITSIKQSDYPCNGFLCLNGFCINNDLTCDGVNHCGDRSDETTKHAVCLVEFCHDFLCLNTLCIAENLTCDGVNHCGDNSDETSHALCADVASETANLGMAVGAFSVLVTVLVACGIFVATGICI